MAHISRDLPNQKSISQDTLISRTSRHMPRSSKVIMTFIGLMIAFSF